MIDFDKIPTELATRNQWVLWRLEELGGKKTKIPFNAATRKRASSTNPDTWTNLETIRSRGTSDFSGIGFVVSESDPYVGVDLDHCIAENGKVESWAQGIIDTLNSYTEITPSGNGLRVWVKGKLPKGRRRRGNLEIYDDGRYFTFSTNRLDQYPHEINDRQVELEAIISKHLADPPRVEGKNATSVSQVLLLDSELLDKIRSSKQAAKFNLLWQGDATKHGEDTSCADLALCNILAFWTAKDEARMDSLFRQSGLMREKWDARRGDKTYGQITIERAIESCRETFTGSNRESSQDLVVQVNDGQISREDAWSLCRDLANEPDILGVFAQEVVSAGLVGEARIVKILYLALVSRFLKRPVSIAVKGPSSGGKSYLAEQVLKFFPDDTYYALSAMSERALAYSEEPLSHKFLVIYEASGLTGDMASYLIRSLLSEGKIRYETVEKTKDGFKPRLIERLGPTGLLVTTTAVDLHPENETRILSLTVTDSREQTAAILRSIASTKEHKADLSKWHALQRWLSYETHDVAIPFAGRLAELTNPQAVRLRRDFTTVLSLIRAHAILYQAQRTRDEEGRVVANLDDYRVIRALVADYIAEGVQATVAPTIREVVEFVQSLKNDGVEPVTVNAIQAQMKLDHSSAYRRVSKAIKSGFLRNDAPKGKPLAIAVDNLMPKDVRILPMPEELEGDCAIATQPKGIFTGPILRPSSDCTIAPHSEGIQGELS
jgi:hypothetical protein